ncbi:hypothetical protein ACNKU7_12590 [Microbulbifer sp. SA54]|uniref:hypothetical protein n=1 Tax=Microbulbifer sp. SA54 TaxID=3401577 RepID=UPI003AAB48DC
MEFLLASLLTSAGVLCLYGSWRNWSPLRPWGTPAGWGLLLASGFAWALSAASIELGVCYALLALTAVAWLFVGINRERRPERAQTVAAATVALPRLPAVAKQLLLLVAVVPLAGAAAMYASTALAAFLPWQQGNALVFAMLLAPVLWGCAAYWQCADSRPLRPAVTMLVLLAVSAGALKLL